VVVFSDLEHEREFKSFLLIHHKLVMDEKKGVTRFSITESRLIDVVKERVLRFRVWAGRWQESLQACKGLSVMQALDEEGVPAAS
jgi:hypothetical protein